jgi:hypothetical protein
MVPIPVDPGWYRNFWYGNSRKAGFLRKLIARIASRGQRKGRMQYYRIYRIQGDGHIGPGETVECSSDDDAIRRAFEMIGDLPMVEVRLDARCVGRFTAIEIARYVQLRDR